MAHSIIALVTKQTPQKAAMERLDIPSIVENGFHIVPLDSNHAIYWEKQWGIDYDADGEYFGGYYVINIKTIERIAREIGITDYALIGTEYFGGTGKQATRVYKHSKRTAITGTSQNNEPHLVGCDINSALKEIGVVKEKGLDEFDTINLGNHRSFEEYFFKYEEDDDE